MNLDWKVCSRARLSRDPRFDGKFFIGALGSGVYCRPICPAPTCKEKNVRYFPTAAAAAEAGFRPCLRCRPECSPGTAAWLGSSSTVSRALRLISESGLEDGGVELLAERLGVGSRHLRRLFLQHLGATPSAVAQTRRLHFAKKLIDETRLPDEPGCDLIRLRLRSPLQRRHRQDLSSDADANPGSGPPENCSAGKSVLLSAALSAALQLEGHVGISGSPRHSRRRIGGRRHVSPHDLLEGQPGIFRGLA